MTATTVAEPAGARDGSATMGWFHANDLGRGTNEPGPGRDMRNCTNEFEKPFWNSD